MENSNKKTTKDERLALAVKESKAPAISRAAAILRLLGKSDSPLGLQTIARELGLVPSTALNVLRALVIEQFVSVDPDTKRYSLEAGVLTLARQWLGRNQFSNIVQPVLDRLSHSYDVTMLGVQIVGLEHMIVVASSEATANFQLRAQIGSRFPALISATGRCIAAFGEIPRSVLVEKFSSLRWDEPPSMEDWLQQIEQTKQQGYAIDSGNYISGVTVVAAPVWKSRDTLSHALVAISIGRRNGMEELKNDLLSAAANLSRQLCGE
ncbi:IclR family transcriptional regulator [Halioxenophilus sp. WMMB6]|uniref:IclR family transcriptional regulator n=1 Tax=Halioxenophilus sp. WMMB6 TaxID=3073815 RepID=UPI00295E38FD|nr:IclR family transcriptional regulator [Halioxenophilus sp. WMMB6]